MPPARVTSAAKRRAAINQLIRHSQPPGLDQIITGYMEYTEEERMAAMLATILPKRCVAPKATSRVTRSSAANTRRSRLRPRRSPRQHVATKNGCARWQLVIRIPQSTGILIRWHEPPRHLQGPDLINHFMTQRYYVARYHAGRPNQRLGGGFVTLKHLIPGYNADDAMWFACSHHRYRMLPTFSVTWMKGRIQPVYDAAMTKRLARSASM